MWTKCSSSGPDDGFFKVRTKCSSYGLDDGFFKVRTKCSSYGPYDVFLRCGPSVALMVLMMFFFKP